MLYVLQQPPLPCEGSIVYQEILLGLALAPTPQRLSTTLAKLLGSWDLGRGEICGSAGPAVPSVGVAASATPTLTVSVTWWRNHGLLKTCFRLLTLTPMNIERVLSREYKVMLRTKPFEGDKQELLKTAGQLWRDFKNAIDKAVGDKDGGLDTITKSRTIKFYDTGEHLLNKNSYISVKDGKLEQGKEKLRLNSDIWTGTSLKIETCAPIPIWERRNLRRI
jgi:hypothetical protein